MAQCLAMPLCSSGQCQGWNEQCEASSVVPVQMGRCTAREVCPGISEESLF